MTAVLDPFPAFDLPRAGGGRLTSAELEGRPFVAYLARHTGCSVCQTRLRELAAHEDRIRAAGAELIVFFPVPAAHLDDWRRHEPDLAHLPAVADEECVVYEALGTRRTSYLHLARRNTATTVREVLRGNAPRLTSADMLRLGADAVVGADGRIAALHVGTDAADRMPVDRLLGCLEQQAA